MSRGLQAGIEAAGIGRAGAKLMMKAGIGGVQIMLKAGFDGGVRLVKAGIGIGLRGKDKEAQARGQFAEPQPVPEIDPEVEIRPNILLAEQLDPDQTFFATAAYPFREIYALNDKMDNAINVSVANQMRFFAIMAGPARSFSTTPGY